MSPRDVYMLGFTLIVVGIVTPPLLMLGQWLLPAADPVAGGPIFLLLTAVVFVGVFIRWLAQCHSCGQRLIWRYDADAPRLLRYSNVFLPPKACTRCGDPLE